MEKAGMVWRRLLSAAAMGIGMLLLPAAASAHAPADHHRAAAGVASGSAHSGCMHAGPALAGGYGNHCHLSSVPSLADGAKLARNHEWTAAPEIAPLVFVSQRFCVDTERTARIPIIGPPNYILFGNFRS